MSGMIDTRSGQEKALASPRDMNAAMRLALLQNGLSKTVVDSARGQGTETWVSKGSGSAGFQQVPATWVDRVLI